MVGAGALSPGDRRVHEQLQQSLEFCDLGGGERHPELLFALRGDGARARLDREHPLRGAGGHWGGPLLLRVHPQQARRAEIVLGRGRRQGEVGEVRTRGGRGQHLHPLVRHRQRGAVTHTQHARGRVPGHRRVKPHRRPPLSLGDGAAVHGLRPHFHHAAHARQGEILHLAVVARHAERGHMVPRVRGGEGDRHRDAVPAHQVELCRLHSKGGDTQPLRHLHGDAVGPVLHGHEAEPPRAAHVVALELHPARVSHEAKARVQGLRDGDGRRGAPRLDVHLEFVELGLHLEVVIVVRQGVRAEPDDGARRHAGRDLPVHVGEAQLRDTEVLRGGRQ
mmetsp:Transcript_24193/g.76053  ORF Transcript_24193/g.76053 Transcript_24193/m.76053 type:complete len:335 (+) Transcript_24193:3834-4838(+)